MIKIDSSALIYAIKMDFLPVLQDIYGEVIITPMVFDEIVTIGKVRKKPDAFIIEKKIKEKSLKIHQPLTPSLPEFNLGRGETEIISDALNEKVPCLLDDDKARIIADKLGLEVMNIPLVLLKAVVMGLISPEECDLYISKWVIVASPAAEKVLFVRKIKEMMLNDKSIG